jgi:TRAP-type C4-dicarboxylate transport system permease small subunit
MLKPIKMVVHSIRAAESAMLVILLLGMMILAVAQIAMRNLLGTGVTWIDPLIRIAVLWIALIGAMIGTREGNHIAIDLLNQYIKGRWKWVVERLANALSAFVCAIMSWASILFVYDEYLYDTPAFGALPAWPFELIIPIGFSVMTIRFSLRVLLPSQEARV